MAGDFTAKLFLVEKVHALQVCLIVNEHFAGFWNDLFEVSEGSCKGNRLPHPTFGAVILYCGMW